MDRDRACEGRVCIVTGAGGGLGREYALALAKAGASVVVNDLGSSTEGDGADSARARQVVDEITEIGGVATANADDVSDWQGAKRLIDQAIDSYGALDVLVNNAGILRDRGLVNMTEEEWDSVIRVHLKGTFAPSHHAAGYWRERSKKGGSNNARLINTTSASGLYCNVGQTNYGAAKAGIAAFTVIAARELGRYGVTVNAIAPGALTRLTEDYPLSDFERAHFATGSVAPVCVWLASELSNGVTERVIEASGLAFSIAEGWREGPSGEPVKDLHEVDRLLRKLLIEARPNATVLDRTGSGKDAKQ